MVKHINIHSFIGLMPVGPRMEITQVSSGEYEFVMGMYRVVGAVGAAVAVGGLALRVASAFIDPGLTEVVNDFKALGVTTAFGGGFIATYCWLHHNMNSIANRRYRNSQSSSDAVSDQ